ncbi:Protein MAM3 [Choanephora cucurbitarum]|uniref:Protein MAM3 n=1 Tax=Choanephora cucurbitarum TaxID=101091 RepID=A0A1C7NT93_9FUNG|nr:Protein MAM3 [Choanephora cucurbitarum]
MSNIYSISKTRTLVVAAASLFTSIYGQPLNPYAEPEAEEPEIDYGSAEFYEKLVIIFGLVIIGGVFAGLTLGLMGLDETNLHVLTQSGSETEKKHAKQVLRLLHRGKHWVLVTLLLSNVIVNETLPIILDGVLGGGWKAVVISTALIVIFGEVIPQSICVRYGLAIGAKTAPMVLALMYVMYPIAYPTAKLLDYVLGESHGTIYKKAGLKSLVSLHQSVNPADVDALTEDEVTIIGAVLDLRSKPVSQIMTPIADVFTLSTDDILNEELVDKILIAGYSRIPVHAPNDKMNFVGMLLTKRLITYDPEDASPVKSLQISTLPETGPDTSCLDILNFFQEGKSHMALISNEPGANSGALGVITLEDVIEELIGEEIIDETDVYVDVHNKIRVVRRQVHNSRRNSRLTRLLSAHKRKPARENSAGSAHDGSKKVVEPYLKPVYGAVNDTSILSTSPEQHKGENQPLLNNRQ